VKVSCGSDAKDMYICFGNRAIPDPDDDTRHLPHWQHPHMEMNRFGAHTGLFARIYLPEAALAEIHTEVAGLNAVQPELPSFIAGPPRAGPFPADRVGPRHR
jgi:hypothetical protein